MSKLASSQSRSFAITFGIQITQAEVTEWLAQFRRCRVTGVHVSFNGQKLIPSITLTKPNNTAPPRLCLAAPLYIVDAFASGPFTGNPAAVCLLETPPDDCWMQSVAAEMNLSETAFLVPRQDGFDLRWFTPVTEVDLCGHATLASAHVLWETEWLPGMNPPVSHPQWSAYRHADRQLD